MNKIKILDLDTKLFGFKTGRFKGRLRSLKKAKEIVKICKNRGIKCLYAEFESSDFMSLSFAVKSGFIISDIRITLEKDLSDFKNDKIGKIKGYQIDDIVRPDDTNDLEQLSKEISAVSRFAFDKSFPKGSAKKLYALWMRNSIRKKTADKIFIAREIKTEQPVGVITCKKGSGSGEIVLVGVRKNHAGRGIGSFVLNHAFLYFKRNGLNSVKIKTQGSNIPALRLYQKKSFFINKTSILFHLWVK